MRPLKVCHALMLLMAVVLLVCGWRIFWFLCDDAYITFRYVSNSMLGYGYVWNPPPFRPVDGYTSFLWTVILDFIWRTTTVAPPVSANWISLLFSGITLYTSYLMIRRILPSTVSELSAFTLTALSLLYILSNRTFLMWTSSGLETALFNALLLTWIYLCVFADHAKRRWASFLMIVTVLIAWTRPDGLLFFGATTLILALHARVSSTDTRWSTMCSLFAGALTVAAFFVWKRITYGSWLPNTYYAKVSDPWPDMGINYLYSFVLEYALWIWAILLTLLVSLRLCRIFQSRWVGILFDTSTEVGRQASLTSCFKSLAIGTVFLHVAYYTFIVGGDHFEYRVYSYLIPLIVVSFIWILFQLRLSVAVIAVGIAFFSFSSALVPWTHWYATKDLSTREETFLLCHPVSPYFPRLLRWYTEEFDSVQARMIYHYVGMRHQEHKVLVEQLRRDLSSREVASKIPWQDFPVAINGVVGYVGWTLKHVALIDLYGLNDYFIARNNDHQPEYRRMAHDRTPPSGYLESFRANVHWVNGSWVVQPRTNPLTEEEIIRIERMYSTFVRNLR